VQRASSESPVRGRRALFFDEFTTVAARWVFAMVIASLTFRTQPHKRAEVLSAMDALLERLRNVPGCVRGRLLADVEDPSAFTLASEWSNGDAVASFFESHEFQIFRGLRILLRDEPFIVLDTVHARVTRVVRNC